MPETSSGVPLRKVPQPWEGVVGLMKEPFSTTFLAGAGHFTKQSRRIEALHKKLVDEGKPELQYAQQLATLQQFYVMSAITNAFAAVEAAINEVIVDCRLTGDLSQDAFFAVRWHGSGIDRKSLSQIAEFYGKSDAGGWIRRTRFWKWLFRFRKKRDAMMMRSLDKFQQLLRLAGKDEFEEGRQVYQDVDVLREFRNYLVHYEGEAVPLLPETAQQAERHWLEKKLRTRGFKVNPMSANSTFPDLYFSSSVAEWAVDSAAVFLKEFSARMGFKCPQYSSVWETTPDFPPEA